MRKMVIGTLSIVLVSFLAGCYYPASYGGTVYYDEGPYYAGSSYREYYYTPFYDPYDYPLSVRTSISYTHHHTDLHWKQPTRHDRHNRYIRHDNRKPRYDRDHYWRGDNSQRRDHGKRDTHLTRENRHRNPNIGHTGRNDRNYRNNHRKADSGTDRIWKRERATQRFDRDSRTREQRRHYSREDRQERRDFHRADRHRKVEKNNASRSKPRGWGQIRCASGRC